MKNKKILIFMAMLFVLFLIIPSFSLADSFNPIDNPGDFKPGELDEGDVTAITSKASPIYNTIVVVGIVVSVITLMIIGIKYMVGSVEQKAEYKKTMIPYIIGIVLLLSVSTILGIVNGLVTDAVTEKDVSSTVTEEYVPEIMKSK